MASSHAAIQENLRGIPTELSASSPTKQANWIALQEKTKHNKANARKLIAVEASEKKARQAGEAGEAGIKAYLSDFTLISLPPPPPSSPPPSTVQLAPPTGQPVLQPSQSVLQPQKSHGPTLNAMQPNKKKF